MHLSLHHRILLSLGLIFQLAAAAVTIPQTPYDGNIALSDLAYETMSPLSSDLSPRGNQKRARRAVTGCPSGYSVQYSVCRPAIDSRAYRIMCNINLRPLRGTSSPWTASVLGSCQEHEICVSATVEGPPRRDTAFCVDLDDMVNYMIDSNNKNRPVSYGASQVGLPSAGSVSSYALEAVLTDSDTRLSLNASSLRVQAQKAVNVHGRIQHQTLPGGMGFCTNCARVSVDPVPEGTQSVLVDMVLETRTQVGNLFLGALEL